MSSSKHSSTESARADRGRQALVVALHKADNVRAAQVCDGFMKRAIASFRRQDSDYAPTLGGLIKAFEDELARMRSEAARG